MSNEELFHAPTPSATLRGAGPTFANRTRAGLFAAIQIRLNVTDGGETNHCSKFVVVIGSERCRTRMNGSNPGRCICLTDVVESEIFKTGQNGPLSYESDALTS
jgi:hypothetical protein